MKYVPWKFLSNFPRDILLNNNYALFIKRVSLYVL